MGYIAATPLLAPLLYLQGRRVRQNAILLPEADGPRSGTDGQGSLMRLLVLGDSSAAGVGAPTQADAFIGGLVANLASHAQVEWKLIAKTGATTASTLRRLKKEPGAHYDIVVTCLGVNDVTSTVGLGQWLSDQRQLRSILREKFHVKRLIINGLPPMSKFPVFPQPLRWYMGSKAVRFSQVLSDELERESDCQFNSLQFTEDLSLMAADGFHPGPIAYREWSTSVAVLIAKTAHR